MDLSGLAAPFAPDAVHWRAGSTTKDKSKGMALAYINARDVIDRLDAVCGPGNWQCEYVPMHNGTTCCRIGILIGSHWVWKSNGAGATDYEAEKGQYSDAFKRAAVLWGVGRYLYDMPSPWVAIDQYKQIDKSELPKLRALLERNGAPPKTASQARKDGVWDDLKRELAAALPRGRMAIDDAVREQSERVRNLPDEWRERYAEMVEWFQDKAGNAHQEVAE